MPYEPLLAHQMAKQRVEDILRQAEQDRLTCVADGSKEPRGRRLPAVSNFANLVALLIRPLAD
jgi:hypothetical protein